MERRRDHRLPVEIFLTQYINDRPYRSLATNISMNGIFLNRLIEPVEYRNNLVQLELSLPGANDTLWIAGEVIYHNFDPFFHQTGIKFKEFSSYDKRLLNEWIRFARNELIKTFLKKVMEYKRRNKTFKYKRLKVVRDLKGGLQVVVY